MDYGDSGGEMSEEFQQNRKNISNFKEILLTSTTEQHIEMFEELQKILSINIITRLYRSNAFSVLHKICSYINHNTLINMMFVCKEWNRALVVSKAWRELILTKMKNDSLWKALGKTRGWRKYVILEDYVNVLPSRYYYKLYFRIRYDINTLEYNWRNANYTTQQINCSSVNTNGIYCIQYDDQIIVGGSRDNSVKIWDMKTLELQNVLTGHEGSVLCLQYDKEKLITGSSDGTMRVWDLTTGQTRQALRDHTSAVLNLKFKRKLLISCSKDWTLKIWLLNGADLYEMKSTLRYHRGAINAIDFDNRFILSASGDRTLALWNVYTYEHITSLTGHTRGIASLHYEYPYAATGSSDNSIRLWNVEKHICLAIFHGNQELVRCIRFNEKILVSGSYDGKIRIWNMTLTPIFYLPENPSQFSTLDSHSGRVFKIQLDHFKIVSSSHDDTIIIWNFLDSGLSNSNFWKPKRLIN